LQNRGDLFSVKAVKKALKSRKILDHRQNDRDPVRGKRLARKTNMIDIIFVKNEPISSEKSRL